MPYKILCWIPVELEDADLYETREEALKDLEHYKLLQPENIYQIVRVNRGGPRGEKNGP